MMKTVLILLFLMISGPALAIELSLPVDCEIGKTCWVQQYADHDSGSGATDHSCGIASYDSHDGTDFRILQMGVKVAVLAAAPGTVKALRDGVDDRMVKTAEDEASIKNVECGNGVVLDHGDGWETQYCHMRKGSVSVQKGDRLKVGDALGEVGMSGLAAFPHVHLTVRKNAVAIDPFSADLSSDCRAADRRLWSSAASAQLPYQPTTLLGLFWGDAPLTDEVAPVEADPTTEWPAILANAWAINLYKGDDITLTMKIPGKTPIVNRIVLDRNKAQYTIYSGSRRPGSWPLGRYEASYEIKRNGVVVIQRSILAEIK